MGKKPNLADFIGEYKAEKTVSIKEPLKQKQTIKTSTPEFLNEEPPTVTKITTPKNRKTTAPLKLAKKQKETKRETTTPAKDYEKVTVTLSPEMHSDLLEASFARRKAKLPHQQSQIMREALEMWLSANT